MSTYFEQVTAEAMKLSLRDRVRLAQQLVSTIGDDVETATETEIEALWLAEAERRLAELHSGSVKGVSAEDAFRSAREALKR